MSIVETLHHEHRARLLRMSKPAVKPKPKPVESEEEWVRPVANFEYELAWHVAMTGVDLQEFEPKKKITIDHIQRAVCERFNVTRADMLSKRRTRNVVRPRQIGAYLARRLTRKSFPEIGRRFGGRDHTTQLWAYRQIGELIKTDETMRAHVEFLVERLGGDPA